MNKIYDVHYFSETRPEMLQFIPPGIKRMLDVGCSKGNFSELVKANMEVECWGIELNPEAAEEARMKLDKVIVGDVTETIESLDIKIFDCIVFNDILEHLLDPWSILNKAKKLLKDDGVIIASIPNFLEILNLYNVVIRQEWDYTDMGILDRTHLRFYTRKSMVKLFEDCGYIVERIQGINPNQGWKWKLFNIATFGLFKDSRYLQFVTIAKPGT